MNSKTKYIAIGAAAIAAAVWISGDKRGTATNVLLSMGTLALGYYIFGEQKKLA